MTAIFDIGKTNKKYLVFGEDWEVLHEGSMRFPEITDEDGFPADDLGALTNWLEETTIELLTDRRFRIEAINVAAYGASFVHLDRDGRPLMPLYNYLKPYPDSLHRRFFDTYGGESHMALETASPVLGSLNSGLQLYRIKYEQPDLFDDIRWSLHLPQYAAWVVYRTLAGAAARAETPANEMTSIGCHTMLWDFNKKTYHEWVHAEGIAAKFPPVLPSVFTRSIQQINGKPVRVGIGMHDSSSALIPYLNRSAEPFLLISTGTWCISLNPFNSEPLTAGELAADCLCYIDYLGRPVKAARYFGGHEHEEAVKLLAAKHGVDTGFYQTLTEGLSPALVHDYQKLMEQIVEKQTASARLALGTSPVRKIFVSGGFSRNKTYLEQLSRALPQMEVQAVEIPEATALGAALAIQKP